MKRTILAATVAFTLGMWVNSVALSEGVATPVIKLGVVDVQKVVENSKQVASINRQGSKITLSLSGSDLEKTDIKSATFNGRKVDLTKMQN